MSEYLDWKYIVVRALAVLFVGWMIYTWASGWKRGRK